MAAAQLSPGQETNMTISITTAIDYLSKFHEVHAFDSRGLYLHYDDATMGWWMIDRDDMKRLAELLSADQDDAYSRWCSGTSAVEIDVDRIVLDYDADESTDLDALQYEAGAADDMRAYMVLRFLRDDVEEIIAQNAEIEAENAA